MRMMMPCHVLRAVPARDGTRSTGGVLGTVAAGRYNGLTRVIEVFASWFVVSCLRGDKLLCVSPE